MTVHLPLRIAGLSFLILNFRMTAGAMYYMVPPLPNGGGFLLVFYMSLSHVLQRMHQFRDA